MRVVVEVFAPGFVLEPWAGTATRFEKATFHGAAGRKAEGFRAELTGTLRSHSTERVSDRVVVTAQALLDLLLRWPLAEPQIRVLVDGKPVSRPRDISRLRPYEIGVILAGGPDLPRTQLTVGRETLPRMELLWSLAMSLRIAELDRLMRPRCRCGRNGARRSATDAPALPSRSIRPGPVAPCARSPPIGAVPPFGSRPCRHGDGPCLCNPQQDRSWARFRDDRRLEAGAAESWLWQLLEREIELRLAGRRLEAIRAVGTTKIGI